MSETREQRLESALKAIRGPDDTSRWMVPYRDAGGGYEGLQAIAKTALEFGCEFCRDTRQVLYHGAGDLAELRACSVCDDGRFLAPTTIPNYREVSRGE